MSSELRVPALKAQARRMVEDWEGPQLGSKPAMIAVLQDLLTAYDAQAARLAEVESERDRLLTLNIERGVRVEGAERWAKQCQETIAAQAARLAAVETERDDALVVVRNAQDYLRGKYTLEPLRTLRDAVRAWEAQQADGAAGAGRPS
jgi:hypothetical protein